MSRIVLTPDGPFGVYSPDEVRDAIHRSKVLECTPWPGATAWLFSPSSVEPLYTVLLSVDGTLCYGDKDPDVDTLLLRLEDELQRIAPPSARERYERRLDSA